MLRQHPSDPQLALGYAIVAAQRWNWERGAKIWKEQSPGFKPESGWSPDVAFGQAVQFGDGGPAPRFCYAVSLLWTLCERESTDHFKGRDHGPLAVQTASDRQMVEHAANLLSEAAARDPQNAFIHYLLAHCAFYVSDEAAALQEITRAEQCSG